MRGGGFGLVVVAVLIGIFAVVNHYVLKQNPVAHFSTIVVVVGVVIGIVGLAMAFMGGRSATAA
jgi:hypothetical protein